MPLSLGGCKLQDFSRLTSPGRVTTKAVQERLTDDDNEHVVMTQPKQEMSLGKKNQRMFNYCTWLIKYS